MATAPLPTSATSALAHEVELKLHVAAEDIDRLKALPALAARADGAPVTRRLRTVYFDTPDLRLYGRGVALRLRDEGGRRVQGLKLVQSDPSGDAAVAVRREWESPITGDSPDFARLDAAGAGALVPQDARAALAPVFTTDVQRTTLLVRLDRQTTVEVAFDDGTVATSDTADGTGERISEIEIELKSGRIGPLFRLARELHHAVPMRIGMESKAELGYRLITGHLPVPVLPEPLALSPLTTAAEAFRHIVRHCLRQLLANEPCALAGGDAEGLHQIRIALRRLRTALRLFAPVIASSETEGLLREIRWLSDRLRPARAWDVLVAEPLDPPDLASAVQAARRAPAAEAVAALRDPRSTGLVLALAGWLEDGGWHAEADAAARALHDRPMAELAGPWLAERHAKARKSGLDEPDRLRRRLRKLRYAVDFFRGLYAPDAARAYAAPLDALLNALDGVHDADVGGTLLARLDDGAAKGHGRRADRARKALPDLLKAFRDAPPFWVEPKKRPKADGNPL